MKRWRLLVVIAMAGLMMLVFSGRAFAGCHYPCPKGMNCLQVCSPLGEPW